MNYGIPIAMRKFVVDEGNFGAKFDRVGNQVAARLTDTAIVNLTRMSRSDGAPCQLPPVETGGLRTAKRD